jgi:hypothetical protein
LLFAVAGCRPGPEPTLLGREELLLAPDLEFLAERRVLVEAGRYQEAYTRWARRALLPATSDHLDTGEVASARRISAAIDAIERSGVRPQTLKRLAWSLDRAGWLREARAVLLRSRRLAPLDPESRALFETLSTMTRFAAAADSALRASYAARDRVESPERIGVTIARLRDLHGLTSEALRNHRLYLGQLPAAADPAVSEVEISVIVGHRGPFTIRQGEAEVMARRVVLDDNLLTAYRPENAAREWDPGTLILVEDGTLIAYHHRGRLRRAAARLCFELERRGGREPDPLQTGEEELALALRLKGVSPIFDRVRATTDSRDELHRQFILEVIVGRMEQAEAGGARHLLDERLNPGEAGGARGIERRLLAELHHGPLPHLRLGDLVEAAARADDSSREARAARQFLRHLDRLVARDRTAGEPGHPGELVGLSETRLRQLVIEIEKDRFRTN